MIAMQSIYKTIKVAKGCMKCKQVDNFYRAGNH
jgi:hypothetical protein